MKITNRTKIIITILLLLPFIIGIIFWQKLPDPMPSHWDFSGNVNDYTSKPLFVFGLPLISLAILWFSMWITDKDPKRANISNSRLSFVLLLIAIICTTAQLASYLFAMGIVFNMSTIAMYIVGIMFILIGNMLPKLQQSYTMGIKLPWTLNSTDNWRLTHRFGGKIFVIIGFLIIIVTVLNLPSILFVILIGIALIAPIIYSYRLNK